MSEQYTTIHNKTPRRKNPKMGTAVLIGAAVVIVILGAVLSAFSPVVTVPTGHTGVVTTFGKVEDYTLGEGLHLKSPIQEVILIDNRTQKASIPMTAFSSDIQQVDIECSINYAVDRENVRELYQRVGSSYYANIMEPRILENVKAVFTRYNAEKLMQVRNDLSNQVKELLVPEMNEYGIRIIAVAIENVDFTDAFTDAVEAKQVAEQTKLKAETEQEQQVNMERSDAERQVIAANAKAEERSILAQADANVKRVNAEAAAFARKIEAETEAEANLKIAASVTEELIRYRAIDRWDGKLPMISGQGGALPILDLPIDAITGSSTDSVNP